MQASKIEVVRWELPRLVMSIDEGKLRIPDFQRAWVWERTKVVALLDSIYREFPIGSFFSGVRQRFTISIFAILVGCVCRRRA